MLVNKTIEEFISEVNSSSPAPGGGSVSALVGALGSSLVAMYTHLSIGKKKYREAPIEIQEQMNTQMEALQTSIKDFMICIDRDSDVYNLVMSAYKLPKETEEEQTTRNEAIYDAIEKAIASPMAIMKHGVAILEKLDNMLPYGNKNAASDFAVGVILLDAAIQGAALNVEINLSSARSEYSEVSRNQMNDLLAKTASLKEKLLTEAKNYL